MVVREGANVTLQCAVTGFPKPTVTWQREDKNKITYGEHLGKKSNTLSKMLIIMRRLPTKYYRQVFQNYPASVSLRLLDAVVIRGSKFISLERNLKTEGVETGNILIKKLYA